MVAESLSKPVYPTVTDSSYDRRHLPSMIISCLHIASETGMTGSFVDGEGEWANLLADVGETVRSERSMVCTLSPPQNTGTL